MHQVKHYPTPLLLFTLMVVIGICSFVLLSGDEKATIVPVVTALIVVIPSMAAIYRRNGGVPFDDIGALYLSAVTLYLVFPIATYLIRGMTFTPFNDSRLYSAQPGPSEIAKIEWLYVIYTVPCAVAYLYFGPKRSSGRTRLLQANKHLMFWCVLILAGIECFLTAFSTLYHLSGDNYDQANRRLVEVYNSIPLLLKQVHAHASGISIVVEVATLVFLFHEYNKYRLILLGWLVAESIVVVGGLGSRSPLVWLVLMMVVLYDHFVKRVRLFTAFLGVSLFLSGYLLFGYLRANLQGFAPSNATFLNSSNEFEALFGSAFDLNRRVEAGILTPPPLQVHIADFLAPIPSQLLPFEKLDGSVWYTRVLGIEDTGAAFAFGVMAQSAIGFGWKQLLILGWFTGYMLARLQRWYKANSTNYWVLVTFVYLEISCYWLFRTSAFYFIVLVVFNVLPVYLILTFLAARSKARPVLKTATRYFPDGEVSSAEVSH